MSREVYVRFFGQLTDITATTHTVLHDVADTNEALAKLKEQYPLLKESTFVLALDKRVINGNTPVSDQQTIAIMPPFSGG